MKAKMSIELSEAGAGTVSPSMRVTLKGGAIKNGYIDFDLSKSIFPSECIGDHSGNKKGMQVHFTDELGNTYYDDIRKPESGTKVRIRARFGKYFTRVKAKEGDVIEIEAIGPSKYSIRMIPISSLAQTQTSLIAQSISDAVLQHEVKSMTATNTILYGPPGTGKTFKTAELAVEICDGEVPESRQLLMERYEELRQEERISFVTFHQSYGYEDFVEGLRPELKDGQVTYRVRPGIFREACDAARLRTLVKPGLNGKPLKERTVYKMSLGRAGSVEGKQALQSSLENGYVLLGWGEDIDFSECKNSDDIRKKLNEERTDIERPESHARFVNVFKDEVTVGDIIIVSQGNSVFRAIGEVTGDYEFLEAPVAGSFHQMRAVRWLAVFDGNRNASEIYNKNFVMSALYKLNSDGLKFDVLESVIKGEDGPNYQNHVLIIDEINRANISKVFGELITLLEPDKRAGEINAITVTLPYSMEPFSVPSNLYVIGTMNTADRSIALLDTALRRRFDFEELQPDYEALPAELEGVNMRAMLRAMNERIEWLYDRDHTIGHAYFINVKSLADLEKVFRRKVIPLLQEYFYEDWAKVRLVLNDQDGVFIEGNGDIPKGLESIADGGETKLRYKVRNTFPVDAYRKIYA